MPMRTRYVGSAFDPQLFLEREKRLDQRAARRQLTDGGVDGVAVEGEHDVQRVLCARSRGLAEHRVPELGHQQSGRRCDRQLVVRVADVSGERAGEYLVDAARPAVAERL